MRLFLSFVLLPTWGNIVALGILKHSRILQKIESFVYVLADSSCRKPEDVVKLTLKKEFINRQSEQDAKFSSSCSF